MSGPVFETGLQIPSVLINLPMDHGVAYWKKLLPRRASKRGCTCRLTSTALCRQRPLPIFTYSTVSLFSRGAATNAVPCSYFDLVLDLLSCNLAHSVALTQNGREATADDIRRACLIRLSAIPPLAALAHNPRFPCSFSTKVCGEIASATPPYSRHHCRHWSPLLNCKQDP